MISNVRGEVEKYPTLTFKSKRVGKAKDGTFQLVGDLTMHGVTRELTLDVKGPTAAIQDPWGNTKVGAVAETTISRKAFGLTWNKALESGGVVVDDEIEITLDIELTKQK
jgi:polyisoprenoid-binding protein YceI